jgi:hypothetical protein
MSQLKLLSEDVNDYLFKSLTNDKIEFEIIFGSSEDRNPINSRNFIKLLTKCRENFKEVNSTTSLDIRHLFGKGLSNVRATINGLESIKKYCRENILSDNVEYILKSDYFDYSKKKKYFPIRIEEYNLRVNIKNEQKLLQTSDNVIKYIDNFENKLKHYRFKKRFSFVTTNNLFKIDLTAVKSSKKDRGLYKLHKNFKESKILNEKEVYELEIEYIGASNKDDNGRIYIDKLYNNLIMVDVSDTSFARPVVGSEINGFFDFESSTPFDEVKSVNDSMFESPWKAPVKSNFDTFIKDKLLGKKVFIKNKFMMDIYKSVGFDLKGDVYSGIVLNVIENYNPKDDLTELNKYGEGIYLQINIKLIDQHLESIKEQYVLEKLKFAKDNSIIVPISEIEYDDFDLMDYKESKEIEIKSELEKQIKDNEENIEIFTKEYEKYIKDGETEKAENTKILLDELRVDKDNLESQRGGGKLPSWAKPYIKPIVKNDIQILRKLTNKILLELELDLLYLLKEILGSNLLSLSKVKDIKQKYRELTDSNVLVGPQLKTLNVENISLNHTDTIFFNYAVTEKADGERCLLFITNGHGYLLKGKYLDVKDTGITFTKLEGDWLFDGEYITKNKEGDDIKLYLIFDIYWSNNEIVYNKPWKVEGDCRSVYIDNFKELMKGGLTFNDEVIMIDVKEYLYGSMTKMDDKDKKYMTEVSKIFRSCNLILNKKDKNLFRYHIDGLIFLPTDLSVKGIIPGVSVDNINGTWLKNFKWKPPEENTIDFQVNIEKDTIKANVVDKIYPFLMTNEDGSEKLENYKKLKLLVKYSEDSDETINFSKKILLNYKKSKLTRALFNPPNVEKILYETNIPLTGNMKCENGDVIKDKDIVEMRYNKDGLNGMIWEPLRVRIDKTEPNHITTTNNVWYTIMNEVTADLIRNKVKPVKMVVEGTYYLGNDTSTSHILRKLNNYIKFKLIKGVISSFNDKKISIMELSCGRGGDNDKYFINGNIEFYLGLDISEDNIKEASKRFFTKNYKIPAVFVVGDTSKSIMTSDCLTIKGMESSELIKHSESMLNILYNLNKPLNKDYRAISKKYYDLGNKKFDIISSQFSLHYYFKTKDTFVGFTQNIFDNIKKGGYFIGTCFDGLYIYDILLKNDLEYKDEHENLIYKISKSNLTNGFSYDEEVDNIDDMFGQEINVYMDSIGQTYPEYLVNFDFFISYMKKNDMELVTPDVNMKNKSIFRKDYLKSDGLGDFKIIIDKLPEIKQTDDDFKLFEKTKTSKFSAADIMNNSKLKLMSGLNKYFIFQKK